VIGNTMRLITVLVGSAAMVLVTGCVRPQYQQPQRVNSGPPGYGYSAPQRIGYTAQSEAPWTQIGNYTGAPGATQPIDPYSISREGIAEPIRGFRGKSSTGFRVSYARSRDRNLDQIRAAFQQERVFEKIAAELNATLRMPRVIDIHLVDCGTVNAFYDPKNSRIILCYEFIGYLAKMFKPMFKTDQEMGTAVIGATLFAFLHELGHALRHQLDLPVTGKEEDAVDQLATLILISGGDQGVEAALSGAYWFLLQGARAGENDARKLPFWDEHSLDQQRFYNIACLIYGSNPAKYEYLTKQNILPVQRAARCQSEYQNISKAWTKLLEPHMTKNAGTAVAGAGWNNGTATPNGNPTPVPQNSGITCEAVADRAIALIAAAYRAEFKQMAAEEAAVISAQLATMLPQIHVTAIQTCYSENWSQASRQCVVSSKSLAQAEQCQ